MNIFWYGAQSHLHWFLFLLIINSILYLLYNSFIKCLMFRFMPCTLHLYMKNFAIKMIKSHILSVVIFSQCPKKTRFLVNLKLKECRQRLLKIFWSSFQKRFVLGHSQNRCTIVSLLRLQKEHKSVWCWINFETDLFVVSILCNILYCIHLNFGSVVVTISFWKESIQSSFDISVCFDHFF